MKSSPSPANWMMLSVVCFNAAAPLHVWLCSQSSYVWLGKDDDWAPLGQTPFTRIATHRRRQTPPSTDRSRDPRLQHHSHLRTRSDPRGSMIAYSVIASLTMLSGVSRDVRRQEARDSFGRGLYRGAFALNAVYQPL